MLEQLFKGLFDTELTAVISVADFLLCLGFSLLLGLLLALAYMYRTRYTKSFVVTLALLPAVVCVVIMMVNGNVGAGVAVAGAFSLVRFRSVPGTAREIGTLFLAMGAGLIAGMGYLGFAALYVLEADKVFLTLAEGTENALSNGGEFVAVDDNNIDAALFSKQDLTLNGAGSLTVTSPAGHGVVCKDDLVITGGTYTVYAASHGIDANDSVRIADGLLTLDAGKDGIHAENNDDASLGYVYISGGTLRIEAEGDGVSAGSTLQLEGGSLDILAGGGSENGSKQSSDSWGGFMGGRPGMGTTENAASEDSTSMKGLKAGTGMLISAGDFTIDSADDAVHSNASITVNGGSFAIATGDDAFHADDTLTVTDGSIRITDSYEGLEALHVVVSGGDIELYASDDGINAAGGTDSSGTGGRGGDRFGGPGMNGGMSSSSSGTIVISGGSIRIEAHGDGIDANGTLTISGGYVAVWGPTQGDTATLDYDVSGVITGGTFIGTGASGMAQTFSSSEQGVIAVSVGSQSAGTTVTVTDEDGNVLLSYEPPLSFSVVIYSSPELVTGQSYTIAVGSASGTFTAS